MPEPLLRGSCILPNGGMVFESWCLARVIDPVNCPLGPVMEFLQEKLTTGVTVTTLRVYVAAIAARRELDEIPLGRHRMVSAFMRGVPIAVPSWDLSVILDGLVAAPFEPLESAPERILTVVEENVFYADLRGLIGPKFKGSTAVQHDLVKCYLFPLQERKNTAERM